MMLTQPRPLWKSTTAPYLMSMYTERDHRQRGHATRIVHEAPRWARAQGCDVMLLHASAYGEAIYRRAGFSFTREMRLRLKEGPGRRGTKRRRKTKTR